MTSIDLASVNVARAETLGYRHGDPVLSGYRKCPVQTQTVSVGVTGIQGDEQADLRVHGGPDKAIYAYSSDHFAFWTGAMKPDQPFGPGSFAENLTLANIDETQICIGDTWQWGEAILQVAQPRYPCFKMAMATERPLIVKRFLAEARSGIYLRVVATGEAPVAGPITLVDRDSVGLTVRAAALALYKPTDPSVQLAVASHPHLAIRWREMLVNAASGGTD